MKISKIGLVGIILSGIVILCLFSLLYIFGISTEAHYDVKKGTLLWFITMDNKTIKSFPIIQPTDNVKYNSIGGDSPSIAAGWEVEYTSEKNFESLVVDIRSFLIDQGFNIEPTDKPECSWRNYKTNDKIKLYKAVSEKGECLDLTLIKTNDKTKIEVLILY